MTGSEGLPRRSKTVSSWHGLIAEVIQLMASGEALTSPRNKELAERYLALSSGDNQILPEESFILMENFAFQGERDGCGSFDELAASGVRLSGSCCGGKPVAQS